jgi:hypothetical protein
VTCRFPDLSDPRGRACRHPTEMQPRETDTDRPARQRAESSRGVDAALGPANMASPTHTHSGPHTAGTSEEVTDRAAKVQSGTRRAHCSALGVGPGGPPSAGAAAIAASLRLALRLAARSGSRFARTWLRTRSQRLRSLTAGDDSAALCPTSPHLGKMWTHFCSSPAAAVFRRVRPRGRRRPPGPRGSPRPLRRR